jgi:hypothetical protein
LDSYEVIDSSRVNNFLKETLFTQPHEIILRIIWQGPLYVALQWFH